MEDTATTYCDRCIFMDDKYRMLSTCIEQSLAVVVDIRLKLQPYVTPPRKIANYLSTDASPTPCDLYDISKAFKHHLVLLGFNVVVPLEYNPPRLHLSDAIMS